MLSLHALKSDCYTKDEQFKVHIGSSSEGHRFIKPRIRIARAVAVTRYTLHAPRPRRKHDVLKPLLLDDLNQAERDPLQALELELQHLDTHLRPDGADRLRGQPKIRQ